MSFMKNLILFFFIFTILFSANTYAATFVIQNQCRYSVWAAAVPGGGVQLAQSQSWTLNVTAGTVGRIWGRTGCNFDAKGHGSCRTGDCNGTLQCRGYGKPPNTLAEFAVNQYSNLDFFDMSLVDGFNIPMDFSPTSNGCTPGINCTADINGQCPTVLRAPGGCNNPCTVFKTNQYCCTSGSCSPTNFSRFFKDRCPDAYSYPKDDQSSTFTCPAGTNYQVVFCPLLSNPRLSPPTPAMSLSPSRTPRPPPLLLQAPPPAMTHSPSPNTTRGRNLMWTIVGTSVSIVFVALLAGSYLCYRCLCKDSDQDARQPLNLGGRNNKAKSEELPLIRLDVIKTATQNFSDTNKLGQGGFGPVYKGVLADGKEIAVKRLSKTSGQGLQEFKNEITLIAKLQHRNLVRLLGCCLEAKESLLIYEYMPNKSLDVILFDPRRCAEIDWKQRLVIINGIARGLLYLHEDSRLRIIHRDLKTSNVLLDNDMIPKISDFGMARIFGVDQVEANTNRVVGTYGYMAPEYAMEGLFSVKSDVYSFGVLLLEIISGKRNGGAFVAQHGENLLTHAWKLWCEGRGLEVMDPSLEETYTESEVLKSIQIGLLCVQDDPADRPTMSYVAAILRSDNYITLPQPTQPLFPVKRLVRKPAQLLEPSLNDLTNSDISPR